MDEVDVQNLPIRDLRLFELTCAVVQCGLDYVVQQQKKKAYIGTYAQFPELGSFDNGMPSFAHSFEGPPDYKTLFDKGRAAFAWSASGGTVEPDFELEKRAEFQALKEYFRASPELWKRTISSLGEGQEKAFLDIEVKLFITYQIDRYLHTYNSATFSAGRLVPIYLPLEMEHLADVLPVNIWVPILFVNFESDEIALDDRVYIRKIPKDIQLARAQRKSHGLAVHEVVLAAATHAFVLTGFEVANSAYGEWNNIAGTATAYPNDSLDLLFAMLRLVTGVDTGYAQLLLEPLGWTNNYEAHLPPLKGM